MIRRIAAIVFALTLHQTALRAQDVVLTVNVPSADVHKGPSTVTPVIGHAPRGAVLPVSRNLGSWVKVSWPDAPDGIGYVHVTMGRLDSASAADRRSARMAPRTTSVPAPAPTAPKSPARPSPVEFVATTSQSSVKPISHVLGVGAIVGSMSTFGASARAWHGHHLGMQVAFTRDAMTSDVAAGRVTSVQVEPDIVYALFDRVSDYVWIRPYVGSGVSFRHQAFDNAGESATDSGVGFRAFGGTELTFAGLTQFGLSVEVGYRHFATPFPGFEAPPLSVSIAGHWYIK